MFHMGGFAPLRLLCGGLLFLLFWAVVIGLLVWAVRAWSRSSATGGGAGPANMTGAAPGEAPGSGRSLEILKERYARGEISKEQYEEMRRDLLT